MTDETQRRRLRRRRLRGSSLSDNTVSEGADVRDLNAAVESRAATARLSESDQQGGSRTDAPPDFTPSNRMAEVSSSSRATPYEREYRLRLIHRMIMRNVPLDQIAAELGVSVSTVIRDRRELYAKLRKEAQKLDINQLIGDTMGFYQEVKGMGLRAASMSKAPLNMRLAAMRTSLAATNDMHRFLNHVGVYDVLRYRSEEGDSSTDIERLVSITESLLNGEDVVDPLQSIADAGGGDQEEEVSLI